MISADFLTAQNSNVRAQQDSILIIKNIIRSFVKGNKIFFSTCIYDSKILNRMDFYFNLVKKEVKNNFLDALASLDLKL